MKTFFSQVGRQWRGVKRYHESSVGALKELDEAIVECLGDLDDSKKKVSAWKAYVKFGSGISDLIDNSISKDNYKKGIRFMNTGVGIALSR